MDWKLGRPNKYEVSTSDENFTGSLRQAQTQTAADDDDANPESTKLKY